MLGGFCTTLGDPPTFVERRLDWRPDLPATVQQQVLDQLAALGIGFGTCHTEFVLVHGRPRLVEVNYRLIGDSCEFLLADLLGESLLERVLRLHLGDPLPRRRRPRPAMPGSSTRAPTAPASWWTRRAAWTSRAGCGWPTGRCARSVSTGSSPAPTATTSVSSARSGPTARRWTTP